ncbi:hypothetical protein, partial [Microseira wollei]|uniref:hypothetical protein n=1 Tax=Microseira wollei TaxID=467598 RepID=UPI001CFE411F
GKSSLMPQILAAVPLQVNQCLVVGARRGENLLLCHRFWLLCPNISITYAGNVTSAQYLNDGQALELL